MNVQHEREVPISNLKNAKQTLLNCIDQVVSIDHSPKTKQLFKRAVYLWLLIYTLTMLPYHSFFWGPDSVAATGFFEPRQWQDWVSKAILWPPLKEYYWVFIAGQVLSLIVALLGYFPIVSALSIWFFTINLDNKAWPTLDGGNNLVEILLVYFIFFEPFKNSSRVRVKGFLAALSIGLSNAAFLMSQIQIALVYACAGLAKASGPLWQKGVAIFYILQSQQYSHPMLGRMIIDRPYIFVLATYGTILFQLTFPLLIWYRRPRIALLLIGCLFHLSIAFVMGLFSFGLAMIVVYSAFFPNEWAEAVDLASAATLTKVRRMCTSLYILHPLRLDK